jgi:hypothetical protein
MNPKTMNTVFSILFTIVIIILILISFVPVDARLMDERSSRGGPKFVLDMSGLNVHNVGELQMHVGNWGIFGSRPNSAWPYSYAPSAQWPAGSGNEYLYVAGLWVGAMKNGIPLVSTAAYEEEFRPTQDPVDVMYSAAEGDEGGNRMPSRNVDDDGDGVADEEWLDGRDNDVDGLVDEDFAAISNQMFSCWYTDNQPIAFEIFPEHNPLNILVRQESYQWENDRFDDFVGIEYEIFNIGDDVLEDVYVGFFADCDAGPRSRDGYWEDDATDRIFYPTACTDLGPVQIDIAFNYDADGDLGDTPGYFGVMFLGHTTDPTGTYAPERVGISTYANFSGQTPFPDGGDPTNDIERYQLLSQERIERAADDAADYRMLVSAGPFAELAPDCTLVFQVAFVAGEGLAGMLANAANAQLAFDGAWFDVDGDMFSGVDGRETPVHGPATNVFIDTCRAGFEAPIDVPRGETVWINNDCAKEELFRLMCNYDDGDSLLYRTGVGGREFKISWIIGSAPPPPSVRIDDHSSDGLVIYWDNYSETVPDVKVQKIDFEGYRVWRADNWKRPLGSSKENGPATELWKLLFEIDLVNNFGRDTGIERYRYEPLTSVLSAGQKQDFIHFIKEHLLEYPLSEPPCPQGVTPEVCDTLKAMARFELGLVGGRRYYRFVDKSIHLGRPYFYAVTALDHSFDLNGNFVKGVAGDPASNFVFIEPKSVSQPAWDYDEGNIYVVPNPATNQSMTAWALSPNNSDPTGIKVEFRNLPRSRGTIRIYTLAGDRVIDIPFDAAGGMGTVRWDLVSRNGQDVTSGVYLYAVETDSRHFDRFIGKFVVIR